MAVKHESDMTAAEKRAQRLETIRNLKGRARLEYVWVYYRWVLVIAAAIIFGISVIATSVRGMTRDIVLSVAVIDADQRKNQTVSELEEQLKQALGLTGNQEVKIDMSATSVDTEENAAKLTIALSSVSGNDIVICGKSVYDQYEKNGAFADMKEVMGKKYESIVPYLTEGKLDLSKCPGGNTDGYVTYSPAYVCVLAHSEHWEEAAEFVELLIQGEL